MEHVGTDINSCRVIDPELKAFFDKVGISESHLEHQETRDFIYDFIESYGGMNAVKKEIKPTSATPTNVQQQVPKPQPKLEPPPPVPARTIPVSTNTLSNNVSHKSEIIDSYEAIQVILNEIFYFLLQSHQRKAPPLPPVQTQSQIPPPPPAVPPVHRSLPSRPPPPSAAPAPASALPPPPPPPPMPQELPSKVVTSAPPPPPLPILGSSARDTDNGNSANDNKQQAPDQRSMLLESIQKGVNLKVNFNL